LKIVGYGDIDMGRTYGFLPAMGGKICFLTNVPLFFK
jgi:hypothetical protein